MAGNPFRRPGAAAAPPGLTTREVAAELSVDTSDITIKPKKVVKKVRIQSPVISPDEQQDDPFDARLNDQGHPGSPPPQDGQSDIATELRRSFIDSVAKGASNLNREAVGDVPPQSHRTGLGTETTASRAAQPHAPYNPFAKTLASIEGTYGSTTPAAAETGKSKETPLEEQSEQGLKGPGKPAMDVDAFTRMLMTGSSTLNAAAPPTLSTPPISIEGSSTENSSISRQSMFDHGQDIHPESPRSSYEESRSDDGIEANEQSSLVAGPEKRAKPPPPAHHRGKLLAKKGPQVVSFADFDASLNSTSAQQAPTTLPDSASSRNRPGRSLSDLNKPLPPPPSSIASPNSGSDTPGAANDKPVVQSTSPDNGELSSKKIRPPPPPTSRRSSQLLADGAANRSRSNSQLSKSSIQEDVDEGLMTPQPTSSQSTKPPPPPSRRAAPNPAPPSADRDASLQSVPHSIPEANEQGSTSKAPPPPPPSRQVLRGTPTLTRTPSTQSTSSAGKRRMSPSLGQGVAPPPPPPRRGDKRSSFDGAHFGLGSRRPSNSSQRSSVELRRSSGASFNNARTPSISSLQHVPEGEASRGAAISETKTQNGNDILADLSAFQAEIDALRAQIGK